MRNLIRNLLKYIETIVSISRSLSNLFQNFEELSTTYDRMNIKLVSN